MFVSPGVPENTFPVPSKQSISRFDVWGCTSVSSVLADIVEANVRTRGKPRGCSGFWNERWVETD